VKQKGSLIRQGWNLPLPLLLPLSLVLLLPAAVMKEVRCLELPAAADTAKPSCCSSTRPASACISFRPLVDCRMDVASDAN
jgi:hypothetical protein